MRREAGALVLRVPVRAGLSPARNPQRKGGTHDHQPKLARIHIGILMKSRFREGRVAMAGVD
jgi:hypothetical protein